MRGATVMQATRAEMPALPGCCELAAQHRGDIALRYEWTPSPSFPSFLLFFFLFFLIFFYFGEHVAKAPHTIIFLSIAYHPCHRYTKIHSERAAFGIPCLLSTTARQLLCFYAGPSTLSFQFLHLLSGIVYQTQTATVAPSTSAQSSTDPQH